MDIPLRTRRRPQEIWELPDDVSIVQHEVSFRGLCPKCTSADPQKAPRTRNK
jgi:Fe2+ or Zn2+ uptake regulation protein